MIDSGPTALAVTLFALTAMIAFPALLVFTLRKIESRRVAGRGMRIAALALLACSSLVLLIVPVTFMVQPLELPAPSWIVSTAQVLTTVALSIACVVLLCLTISTLWPTKERHQL